MVKQGKIIAVSLMLILLDVLAACKENQQDVIPYTFTFGAYEYGLGVFTNKLTNEVVERTFEDILNDKELFKYWHCLFSFSVGIHKDTEFIKKGNCWFLIYEGLAYEVIGESALKLHFPRWSAYDYKTYDIVIYLGWRKSYG